MHCGALVACLSRTCGDQVVSEGGGMLYQYQVPEGYEEAEVTAVLAESIQAHLAFAQRRMANYQASCATFEQRHGMSTEEFLAHFAAGDIGDEQEWFDWYSAAQGKNIWSRKYDILVHLR